jgi:hypothetical protein
MCVEKANAESTALKIEGAMAATAGDYSAALDKRRAAVRIHEIALKREPGIRREANQRYLEYWQYVTEGYTSLLGADFGGAKKHFERARDLAGLLDARKCFPNYFRDIRDIATYGIYVDAVAMFRSGEYAPASVLFQQWLHIHSDRKAERDLRFDNISICNLVSRLLAQLAVGDLQGDLWRTLDRLVDDAYVARTTWALLDRIRSLREMSFLLRRRGERATPELLAAVAAVAESWQLLVPDSILLGVDRTAGLQRAVVYPSFLDLLGQREPPDNWPDVMAQALRHLLLVLADYEWHRYVHPPVEEEALPSIPAAFAPNDDMSTSELVRLVERYLLRRSIEHHNVFTKALGQLRSFELALADNSYRVASDAWLRLCDSMRLTPHIVRIEQQTAVPQLIF